MTTAEEYISSIKYTSNFNTKTSNEKNKVLKMVSFDK